MAIINGDNNANVLEGTIFGDIIRGFGGDDRIDGRSGSDIIEGGPGEDSIDAGSGDDVLVVRNGDLAVFESYSGGRGIDELRMIAGGVDGPFTADFSGWFLSSIEQVRFLSSGLVPITAIFDADEFEQDELDGFTVIGGTGVDKLEFQFKGFGFLDLRGVSFSNWGANDQIFILGEIGFANQTVFGSSAAEFINTAGGIDEIDGGGGDDIITAIKGSISGGSGFDSTFVKIGNDLTDVQFASIESLFFGFNANSVGRAAQLRADQFGGGQISSSVLIKSEDPDTDLVVIAMEEETAFSAAAFQFDGFGANDLIKISGDNDAESITGSSHHDQIFAGGGNDFLLGGDGNDFLDGSVGNDAMFGGAGDDTYTVSSADDDVIEFALFTGEDTGGIDTVRSFVDFTLGAFVENLALLNLNNIVNDIDGTGNGLANVITGNDEANVLTGLAGADELIGGEGIDRLFGGNGNDTLQGGLDADAGRGGLGNDTYVYALGDGVDNVFDTGGAADRLRVGSFADIVSSERVGDDLKLTFSDGGKITVINHFLAANQVENVADANGQVVVLAEGTIGGNDSGIISGTGGADYLSGRGGDDLLFGAAGDDLLFGGRGRDRLDGGTGDDVLSGGRGRDQIVGGEGDDVLLGRGGKDTFVLAAGEGQDTLYDFASGIDVIGLDRDSFGFAEDASRRDAVKIGGEAPTAGAKVYVTAGTIVFDDDWGDAAGREILALVQPDSPVLSDFILI